jgi:transcriptional regulator with XRE-family HTH domain
MPVSLLGWFPIRAARLLVNPVGQLSGRAADKPLMSCDSSRWLQDNPAAPPYTVGHLRTSADKGAGMDVSPYTDDLDIASVNGWDELSALLRTVHLRADKPSLRTLEARSRHGATPLSKTVVSEMLRGTRFPRKTVMLAFLQACGIQDERVEPWLRAWERIAERTAGPRDLGTGRADEASPPEDGLRIIASAETDPAETRSLREQVDQLSADNERLRMRIVAAEATSAGEAARPDDEADDHPAHGPLASRRELGVLLRALREEKGITVEQAATRLLCSARKINQMESRFRSGTVRDVRDLCEFYGVTKEADRRHLMQLARNSRQQGWYESYNTDPRWSPYIDFEDDASHIKLYYSAILPGMMQTAEYFRALHQNSPHDFTAERIEQFTEVRLKRQRILTRPDPPRFWAILDEAALRRSVGGPTAMRDQLSHIIEMSTLPNVTLQVIPFDAGAHAAMDTSFTILEFNDPVPAMVYVEGLPGFFYMENPADVAQSQRMFEILSAASLSEEDSVQFINRMISR